MPHHSFAQTLIITPINVTMTRDVITPATMHQVPTPRQASRAQSQARPLCGPQGPVKETGEQMGHCNSGSGAGLSLEQSAVGKESRGGFQEAAAFG